MKVMWLLFALLNCIMSICEVKHIYRVHFSEIGMPICKVFGFCLFCYVALNTFVSPTPHYEKHTIKYVRFSKLIKLLFSLTGMCKFHMSLSHKQWHSTQNHNNIFFAQSSHHSTEMDDFLHFRNNYANFL